MHLINLILLSLLIPYHWIMATIIFQTNIYFDNNMPHILSFCRSQRPEDAISDFLLQFDFDGISTENVMSQILIGLCDSLPQYGFNCDGQPPTKIISRIDMTKYNIYGKYLNLREGYDSNFFMSCWCAHFDCSTAINLREEIENILISYKSQTISRDEITSPSNDNLLQFQSHNYFTVLGLEETANESDIKQSFKDLARKYHPDKNLNNIEWATAIFKNISVAYDILSNPVTRKQHQDSLRGGSVSTEQGGSTTSTTFSFSSSFSFGQGGGFTFTFKF
jgi:DnaJ-domain-containing protein 1